MSQVPIVRPDLGEEEVVAATRVIRSGWILQGPEVAAFEGEFAAAVGAPHAVAVSSCTSALELALRVLGVGPGDEVITVSHSFIATANAIAVLGARPVFVDVDAETYGMDPRHLAAALGPRTRAVLVAHQLGIPCRIDELLDAAAGVPVIEDAACALGSELRGERIGRPRGAIACFSFHPRKVLTTGDGGMLTTGDAALAERVRRLRQHGLTDDGFVEPGWNHRMTDLQAAIGRTQLARLDASLAERRRIGLRYEAALTGHPHLAPPAPPAHCSPNWQSYPARARAGDAGPVLSALAALGVGARPGIVNAHEQPAYRGTDRASIGPLGLAMSERLARDTVLLPLFHGLTAAEEEVVLRALGSD